MNRWTTYNGTWNDQRAFEKPSTDLGLEVDAFESQLGLKPDKGFPKSGVVRYHDERGANIMVVVKSLTYPGFKSIGGFHTPLFVFDLVVSADRLGRVLSRQSKMEVVYKGIMEVTFMEDYPNDYPTFKIPKYKTFSGMQHNHHMYTGGRMCLYGNFGHSPKAWDSEHGTA
ncbi:MAG: hypothetical protein UU16_C0032G0001, partial [Candidatus Woesebacteria bacterium GW2011_GWA2_40_7]